MPLLALFWSCSLYTFSQWFSSLPVDVGVLILDLEDEVHKLEEGIILRDLVVISSVLVLDVVPVDEVLVTVEYGLSFKAHIV
jgi:hypothetical protein